MSIRLIEVAKSDLKDLPVIVELRGVPQKFIIFVDDLSFEEDDDAFKALKVVLEEFDSTASECGCLRYF